jgi:uncharacterized protein (DUF433 family)
MKGRCVVAGTVLANAYITLNDKGRAIVSGTRSKVTMVVRDHLHGGMTPQEIHDAYPHLSLAAIHAALSYYYDHKAELDAEMEQGDRQAEEFKRQLDASGTRFTRAELERRLREKGKQA